MKKLAALVSTMLLSALPLQAEWVSCPQECCQPCWGVEVYGEYLYWKVSEDQLQYAATLEMSTGTTTITTGTLLSLLSTKTTPSGEPANPQPLISGLNLIDPDFGYN